MTAPPASRYHVFRTKLGYCGVLQTGARVVRTCTPVGSPGRAVEMLAPPIGANTEATPLLRRAEKYLRSFFDGDPRRLGAPEWLEFPPTGAFFGAVYRQLMKVPAGKVVTYRALAKKAGSPGAGRAVGQAMAANPLAPIIPCHRVVRSDGSLGGYSAEGGLALKRLLLEREGVSFDERGRVRF